MTELNHILVNMPVPQKVILNIAIWIGLGVLAIEIGQKIEEAVAKRKQRKK